MRSHFATFLLISCIANGAIGVTQQDFAIPPPPETQVANFNLWATYYYVHSAKESASGAPLRDKTGKSLTVNISPRDWCLGAIEGTIQVVSEDNRSTFSYAGIGNSAQVDCAAVLKIDPKTNPWIDYVGRSFYVATSGPFGDGVARYILVPFRTIAVDPNKIPFGTALYIPRAKGSEISLAPGITVKHDGYFFAADTGGAIKGQHIDVFCGASATNCLPTIITSNESKGFKSLIVRDPAVLSSLKALHTR